MDQATAEIIEKYQIEFQKNPRSKVFAPLAESYRKANLTQQALAVAKSGVQQNPKFSGGRVVLGKIYEDMGQNDKALNEYKMASEIDPSNILAHKLLAHRYLGDKEVKKALSSFKMVLFLKPNDKASLEKVKKLESFTAEDFEADSFQVQKINSVQNTSENRSEKALDRALSLADAFLVRGEFEKSFEALTKARQHFGEKTEILKRLKLIDANIETPSHPSKDSHTPAPGLGVRQSEHVEYLKGLIHQIHKRRR